MLAFFSGFCLDFRSLVAAFVLIFCTFWLSLGHFGSILGILGHPGPVCAKKLILGAFSGETLIPLDTLFEQISVLFPTLCVF